MKRIGRYLIDAQTLIEGLESVEGSSQGDDLDMLWKLVETNRIEILMRLEEWEALRKYLYANVSSRSRAEAILYDIGKVVKISPQEGRKNLKSINFSRIPKVTSDDTASIEEIVVQNSLVSVNTSSVMLQSFAAIATLWLAKEALKIRFEGEDYILDGVGSLFGIRDSPRQGLEALIAQAFHTRVADRSDYLDIISSGPARLYSTGEPSADVGANGIAFNGFRNWRGLVDTIYAATTGGGLSYQDIQDGDLEQAPSVGEQGVISASQESSANTRAGRVVGRFSASQTVQSTPTQSDASRSTVADESAEEGTGSEQVPELLGADADAPIEHLPEGDSVGSVPEASDSPVVERIYGIIAPNFSQDADDEGTDPSIHFADDLPSVSDLPGADDFLSFSTTLMPESVGQAFASTLGAGSVALGDVSQAGRELIELAVNIDLHLQIETSAYQSIYEFETNFNPSNGLFADFRTFALTVSPRFMATNPGMFSDVIDDTAEHNWMIGSFENDLLRASSGDDLLDGSYGDDQLEGGVGNDILNGGVGNDILNGGSGDDILLGGSIGSDRMTGGSGVDTFLLLAYGETARISDFNVVEGDRIVITDLYDYEINDYFVTTLESDQGVTIQLNNRWSFIEDSTSANRPIDVAFLEGVANISSDVVSFV